MVLTRRFFSQSLAAALASRRAFSARRPGPRLCLLIIAEQMRADAFSDLASNGGTVARLAAEGSYFPDCRFHSTTFSSSGLATILTGAYPQNHGIVADSWYDRKLGIIEASPEHLQATTLADIAASQPETRVAAIGGRPQHASLLGGQGAWATFAMDPKSQYQSLRLPSAGAGWLEEFQAASSPEKLYGAKWMALGAPQEAPPLRTLTFDKANPEEFHLLYRASPFALTAQFDLLRELIARERMGQEDTLDFLAVALNPMALLGYEVGAASPLLQQMALHLDRELGITLELLERLVGPGNFTLAFTGAHGAPPEPAPKLRASMAVPGEALARTVDAELSRQLDYGGVRNRYVERYLYPFLYLRPEPLRRGDLDARAIRRMAGEAALAVPGVTGYYTANGDCSHSGDWLKRFAHSFHATRSGDLMLAYGPEKVEEHGAGRGISYGSIYNYDARVPLLFFGPQFRAESFHSPVEAIDIAPTLSRVLGLALPSSATGRVLAEALEREL
jgi:Type I phosphodiesterase / nucleotide pyrophosphatase